MINKIVFVTWLGLLSSIVLQAQEPKMYLKAYGGANTTTFQYRLDSVSSDILAGWQAGIGFRLSRRKVFGEVDICFIDYAFTFNPNENTDPELGILFPLTLRINSLDIPLTAGYIPYHIPWLKWYVYGGINNRFGLRGRLSILDETIKISPRDIDQPFYNLGLRLGSQLDIAMFNLDFNYTLGITNAFKDRIRTNAHSIQLNVGILF
jgi:hypothetical protein